MKKQTYLWLPMLFTTILVVLLAFNPGQNSAFVRLCYAQESDQAKEEIFKELEETLQRAEDEDVILLSPGNFARANEFYQKALQDYEAGEGLEKTRENLERSMEYINAAFGKAKLSRTVLENLIQTRKEAKELEIPKRAAYIFSKAESMFTEAAMKVEDGDLISAESVAKDTEREYRVAVIEALEKFVLADARKRLKNIEPTIPEESFREAKTELDKTEAFIKAQEAADFAIGELVGEVDARIQKALTLASVELRDLTVEGLAPSPESPYVGEIEPLNPPGIKFIARAGIWGYIVLSIVLCAVFFLLGVIVFAFLTRKPRRRLSAMKGSDVPEMEFQLMKLFNRYADLFEYHQWPLEHLRWTELIFALVSRISHRPESELRDIIEELDYLELLDIEELSQVPETKSGVDLSFLLARRIMESLAEAGFTEEESESTLLVMHEAAKNLKRLYEGKIQECLRKYGQQMIDELSENFSFSRMNEADTKYAFTYWLQNVLNMPVSLSDENVKRFCEEFGKKPEDLVEAADKLDINLALLDDIIQQHMEGEAGVTDENSVTEEEQGD